MLYYVMLQYDKVVSVCCSLSSFWLNLRFIFCVSDFITKVTIVINLFKYYRVTTTNTDDILYKNFSRKSCFLFRKEKLPSDLFKSNQKLYRLDPNHFWPLSFWLSRVFLVETQKKKFTQRFLKTLPLKRTEVLQYK